VAACYRMPTGSGVADNFAAGGLAAPLGEDGRLGCAVRKDIRSGSCTSHPDTGAAISGAELPFWREMVELAKRAHRCVGDVAFVGWDVACIQSGPILVEANPYWCGELVQISHDQPLGEMTFPHLLRDALEAVSRRDGAVRPQ